MYGYSSKIQRAEFLTLKASMAEFEKEIALIKKMGLKTSPLRLEYEIEHSHRIRI